MSTRTLLPMLFTLCCVAVPAVHAQEESARERARAITVTGNAQVRADPDRAFATFGIQAEGKNAQDAQNEANGVIQRVLEGLRGLGIPPRNIQTTGLSLQPVYENPPVQPRGEASRRPPRISGYVATNNLTVLVEKLDQVGPVIDAAMAAGANTIQGVHFSLLNDLPQRLEALRTASEEARRKAETIATALGVTLGPLHTATESYARVVPMESAAAFMRAAAPAPTPVAAGQVVVEATVTVAYDIGAAR